MLTFDLPRHFLEDWDLERKVKTEAFASLISGLRKVKAALVRPGLNNFLISRILMSGKLEVPARWTS